MLLLSLFKLPMPLMVLATVTSSERLKIRAPLFSTLPVPKVPDAPPAPTCKVPLLMEMMPLWVLLPVSVTVLGSCL